MSGSVFETWMRPSSGSGLPSPGSTSRNMSFVPVLARSSAVASSRMKPLYFGSSCEGHDGLAVLEVDLADVADLARRR